VARGGRFAPVQQRQLDVFLRRGARQQVEALEHEAEVAPPQPRALVARERLHRHALEQVLRRWWAVQAAQVFIAVDLPEPLGPMMATNSPA
jgi:hypothetical protein